MFKDSFHKITGYSYIKSPIPFITQNIDIGSFHSHKTNKKTSHVSFSIARIAKQSNSVPSLRAKRSNPVSLTRHCERSEAIQICFQVDCHGSLHSPRNDQLLVIANEVKQSSYQTNLITSGLPRLIAFASQ